MAKGYKTGGRRKGTPNKITAELREAAMEGLTPLEYMLQVLRDETEDEKRRDAMAVAAAPYLHPKLSATEHSGNLTINHEDRLKELE